MTETRVMYSLALSVSKYREFRALCKFASAKLESLSKGETQKRSYRLRSVKKHGPRMRASPSASCTRWKASSMGLFHVLCEKRRQRRSDSRVNGLQH
jgi:hypothetical protein